MGWLVVGSEVVMGAGGGQWGVDGGWWWVVGWCPGVALPKKAVLSFIMLVFVTIHKKASENQEYHFKIIPRDYG